MAKKESTFLNMTLTLFIVTLLSSTALGFIYEFTKAPIAVAKSAKQVMAINKVVPDFDNSPLKELKKVPIDGDTIYMFPARENGKLVFSTEGF